MPSLSQSESDSYLFVIPWSLEHVGGVNQVVLSLAHEMHRSGVFNPIVLVADWNARSPIWEKVHGIQTVRWRVRPLRADMGWKEKMAFKIWRLRFQGLFQRFCHDHRVAAVNIHYPGQGALAFDQIVRQFSPRVPFIISFHGSDISRLAQASAHEKARWQGVLERAKGVVVCSADLGKRVAEVFGPQLPLQLIYNGIDASAFAAAAAAPALATDGCVPHSGYILSVGKFISIKGQDLLIEAFARIAPHYSAVNLVLVGASGNALASLRDLSVRHGLQERVQFFSDIPHAQMAGFFQRARMFCLPSRMEAFGLVLLEAAAFALPVIASRVGGIPEVVQHGVSGLLVAPEDIEALAQALRALLDAPQAAEKMGVNLRHYVTSQLTWTSACAQYRKVVQD